MHSPKGPLLSDFLNNGGLAFLTTVCAEAAKVRDIDTHDLVQETIIRTMGFLEREVARDFARVLCSMAYCTADDLQRKMAREKSRRKHMAEMSIVAVSSDPLEEHIEREHQQRLRKRLHTALKTITPKRRRIVAMCRVWRCASNAHIARKLGVSRGTVLNDWHSALAQLCRFLPEYNHLFPA